jgi:threonine/homoserine/homoserine lactone efflux protein
MGGLVLAILPLALGAAVSPVLFGIEVLALTSPKSPRAKGWMVVIGAAGLLVAVALAWGLLGNQLPHRHAHRHIDGAIDLIAAFLLALLATRQFLRRSKPTKGQPMTERLNGASTRSFLVAGVGGMLLNFSSLVLFIPAMHEITKSSEAVAAKVLCALILIVITLLPVWIPAVTVTALGKRAEPTLKRVNTTMSRHSLAITMGIEIVFTVFLLFKGLKAFL